MCCLTYVRADSNYHSLLWLCVLCACVCVSQFLRLIFSSSNFEPSFCSQCFFNSSPLLRDSILVKQWKIVQHQPKVISFGIFFGGNFQCLIVFFCHLLFFCTSLYILLPHPLKKINGIIIFCNRL